MLDRREDVRHNILPALVAGKLVIMDRYYLSNIAYQGARGLDPEMIRRENEQFSPVPDLVLVLDIDPALGLARITDSRKTALDSFEKEDYLRRVRDIFLAIGRKPNGVIIDASQPPEKVHAKPSSGRSKILVIFETCERSKAGRTRSAPGQWRGCRPPP